MPTSIPSVQSQSKKSEEIRDYSPADGMTVRLGLAFFIFLWIVLLMEFVF